MLVNLKRNWFGPDDKRYRQRNNPVEIPEQYREVLPKDAVVLDEGEPKKAAKAPEDKKGPKPAPNAPDALTL